MKKLFYKSAAELQSLGLYNPKGRLLLNEGTNFEIDANIPTLYDKHGQMIEASQGIPSRLGKPVGVMNDPDNPFTYYIFKFFNQGKVIESKWRVERHPYLFEYK